MTGSDALAVVAGLLVLAVLVLGRQMGWLRRPPAPVTADLTGRVVVVTGANSGIGLVTAGALASLGAHVVMACRSLERGRAAADALREEDPTRRLEVRTLDLSDLDDVRRFAAELLDDHDQLHVLVNNAGRIVGEQGTSPQGHELTLATNHLGPFLLTQLLLPRLRATPGARVVNVASAAHRQGSLDPDALGRTDGAYNAMAAYSDSKLANVLFTRELARRVGDDVVVNCVHPGTIRSGFGGDGDAPVWLRVLLPLASWTFMTPERGADSQIWLAAAPEAAELRGAYVVRRRVRRPSADARDDRLARALWERTTELVGA